MKRAQAMQQQQQRMQRMPAFMHEPFMMDQEYIKELGEIVKRGWRAPSVADGGDGEEDENGDGGEIELDFSDFGKKAA